MNKNSLIGAAAGLGMLALIGAGICRSTQPTPVPPKPTPIVMPTLVPPTPPVVPARPTPPPKEPPCINGVGFCPPLPTPSPGMPKTGTGGLLPTPTPTPTPTCKGGPAVVSGEVVVIECFSVQTGG